jgi:hypothetical protein
VAQATPPAPEPPTQEGGSPFPPGGGVIDSRLRDVLLTPNDVPNDLWLDADTSGRFAAPGISGYLATYVHSEAVPAPDLSALLDLPAGTIALVKSSVQMLSSEAMTAEALDAAIGGAQAATTAGGALVDTTTTYGVLPLGEASRARSLHFELEGVRVASTAIVFQRGEVIAALNVVAIGDDPAFLEAEQLAQMMDERLAELVPPAADAAGASPTPVSPPAAPPDAAPAP